MRKILCLIVFTVLNSSDMFEFTMNMSQNHFLHVEKAVIFNISEIILCTPSLVQMMEVKGK